MSTAASYVCKQFVEDVTAYLDGALHEDMVLMVEHHLADCPHCRAYLAQMRETIALTRGLTEYDIDEMPADVRERLMQAFRERRD